MRIYFHSTDTSMIVPRCRRVTVVIKHCEQWIKTAPTLFSELGAIFIIFQPREKHLQSPWVEAGVCDDIDPQSLQDSGRSNDVLV